MAKSNFGQILTKKIPDTTTPTLDFLDNPNYCIEGKGCPWFSFGLNRHGFMEMGLNAGAIYERCVTIGKCWILFRDHGGTGFLNRLSP